MNEYTDGKQDAFLPLAEAARRLRLEPQKKSLIKARIIAAMRHPAPVSSAPPFAFLLRNRAVASAALAIAVALIGGTGVCLAAQGALPGDLLYPVKTRITEKILGAFIASDQTKANYDIALANRRLQELEQVASEHKLTPQDAAQVQSLLNGHIADAQASIAQIRKTSGDAVSLQIDTRLEAVLNGHEAVLAQLSQPAPTPALSPIPSPLPRRQSQSSSETPEGGTAGLHSFLSDIRQQASAVQKQRQDDESAAATSDSPQTKILAQQAMNQANAQLKELQTHVPAGQPEAHDRMLQVQASIAEGDSQFNSGAYGSALVSFQDALRNIKEFQTYLSRRETLRLNITAPALLPLQTDSAAHEAESPAKLLPAAAAGGLLNGGGKEKN